MKEILQLAIAGLLSAVTRWERVGWSLILAVAIGTLLMLGGCGSNQLPSISVDVVPAGGNKAPAPAQIVVVPAQAVQSVPQK